jgi:hypothetical protein
MITDKRSLAGYLVGNKHCPDCGSEGLVWTRDIGIMYTAVLCEGCFSKFSFNLDQQVKYPYIPRKIGRIEVIRYVKLYEEYREPMRFREFLNKYKIGEGL